MAQCRDCRFWLREEENLAGGGTCQRYAPRPLVGPVLEAIPYWPKTNEEDWCGEFQPKSKSPPK
jgi:hypothetical protein